MGTLKMGVYLNDFGLIGSQEGIERLRKEISSAQFQQKVARYERGTAKAKELISRISSRELLGEKLEKAKFSGW